MAYYNFPSALFPSNDTIERLYHSGSWNSIQQQIRSSAFMGNGLVESADKELTRFITPHIAWPDIEKGFSQYTSLGDHSWLATTDRAPFIPPAAHLLIEESFRSPRSLMHMIGATFSSVRILYVAEDIEVTLDRNSDREVLLLVVEPGVLINIYDAICSYSARTVLSSLGRDSSITWTGDHSGQLIHHDRWMIDAGATLTLVEAHTDVVQSWTRKEFILSEKSHVNYTLLSALRNDEQSAVTTIQEHRGQGSTSSVLVKTVGAGTSRSFYRGTIHITEQAPQARADQHQRALLLSSGARTCAIPSLEVAIDDVQCSHGSAVGQFDQDALQYVQSRGMSIDQAQKLIIEGFFTGPYVTVHPDIRKRLMAALF